MQNRIKRGIIFIMIFGWILVMCYDVCTLDVVINVNDVSYVKMNMLVMLN